MTCIWGARTSFIIWIIPELHISDIIANCKAVPITRAWNTIYLNLFTENALNRPTDWGRKREPIFVIQFGCSIQVLCYLSWAIYIPKYELLISRCSAQMLWIMAPIEGCNFRLMFVALGYKTVGKCIIDIDTIVMRTYGKPFPIGTEAYSLNSSSRLVALV